MHPTQFLQKVHTSTLVRYHFWITVVIVTCLDQPKKKKSHTITTIKNAKENWNPAVDSWDKSIAQIRDPDIGALL